MGNARILIPVIALAGCCAWAQTLSSIDRQRGHVMLRFTEKDLREHYYDPGFRGIDITRRFIEADALIDSASTLGEMFNAIAAPFAALGDAHTVFVPPLRTLTPRYGWEMAMFGDTCFVSSVEPGSDADMQGLRPGDMICSVEGLAPGRANLRRILYTLRALDPKALLAVRLRTPEGLIRDLRLGARVTARERVIDVSGGGAADFWNFDCEAAKPAGVCSPRLKMLGSDVAVWKLPRFDVPEEVLDRVMENVGGVQSLILDLRNNPGGRVGMLAQLAGYFFDRDVTLFYTEGRNGRDSLVAHRHEDAFRGRLFVLIDSRTLSSAEIFARTMQIESRGIVLGDVSGGSVMEALYHPRSTGAQNIVTYGSNISIAAVIMPDGVPLEGSGVIPDDRILPSAHDLADGLDPVMARATSLAGVPLGASRSGSLFSLLPEK